MVNFWTFGPLEACQNKVRLPINIIPIMNLLIWKNTMWTVFYFMYHTHCPLCIQGRVRPTFRLIWTNLDGILQKRISASDSFYSDHTRCCGQCGSVMVVNGDLLVWELISYEKRLREFGLLSLKKAPGRPHCGPSVAKVAYRKAGERHSLTKSVVIGRGVMV